ncbi:GAF and ANTAR domain-containing protein [Actinoplanes sp. NPDC023936]|uniref:GAF and ANTAR domain-containing protein n=1 Tax=Actinoplanes sp. NPDC023936 TaxID=3154910 RepID=UPI00340D1504
MTSALGEDERRAFVRRLIDRQPADLGLLQRICLAAVEALAATGSGISVMTSDGTRGVCAASDPLSERVEDFQFVLGEGPCIDAFAARRPVLTPDLSDAGPYRWPFYGPAARGDGVRAVFAFPLQVGAARLGVMDVFRDRAGPLNGAELRTAFTLTEVAVEALLDREQNGVARDGDAGALEVGRRAELFQAQGMVMMQLGVSIGEALARMRAHAYAQNRRLEEVARDVVERRLRLDGSDE